MHALPLALLVTVRLYDSFGLPPGELHSAMLASESALRSGSVRVAWVVCPPAATQENTIGCGSVPGRRELLVRIVRAPMASTGAAGALGFAAIDVEQREGTLATVFADRVTLLATLAHLERATLLGYAMAHEIGHLLLGSASHAPAGLMRASWTVAELRRHSRFDWRFSRDDASALAATRDPGDPAGEPRDRDPAGR